MLNTVPNTEGDRSYLLAKILLIEQDKGSLFANSTVTKATSLASK